MKRYLGMWVLNSIELPWDWNLVFSSWARAGKYNELNCKLQVNTYNQIYVEDLIWNLL